MIQFLIVAVLAVLGCMGGTYVGLSHWREKPSVAVEKQMNYESVGIAPVAVPMIRDGQLRGYAIAKVTVLAVDEDAKKAKANIILYVTEALFRMLFDDREFDPTQRRPAQLEALSEKIAVAANMRLGSSTVKSVVFESINVVDPGNVRGYVPK